MPWLRAAGARRSAGAQRRWPLLGTALCRRGHSVVASSSALATALLGTSAWPRRVASSSPLLLAAPLSGQVWLLYSEMLHFLCRIMFTKFKHKVLSWSTTISKIRCLLPEWRGTSSSSYDEF